MDRNILERMNQLCGDYDTSFNYGVSEKKVVQEIQETVKTEETFFDKFGSMYNLINEYELNESEADSLDSLKIVDELLVIQEALESIKEKAQLCEDIGMLGVAIPGLAALTVGLIKSFLFSEVKTPTKVANVIHDIGNFVSKGNEKERRAIIKASLTRGNPNMDPKLVDKLIDKAMEENKEPTDRSQAKDSRISGKGVTDFAAINRKRFNLAEK